MELSKGYSPFLSFNVKDMDDTVLRLLSMGAELDGPIKHPPQGKVCCNTDSFQICDAFSLQHIELGVDSGRVDS